MGGFLPPAHRGSRGVSARRDGYPAADVQIVALLSS
jgi:hypothetical protein